MKQIKTTLNLPPLVWIGASLALLWVVYAGVTLRARLGLPPLDTSRSIVASMYDQTAVIQTTPDGQVHPVYKSVGPTTTWKKGLVYWDGTKQCLFCVLPGQKARPVRPQPPIPAMAVFSLIPAPDAVYLTLYGTGNPQVVRVRLTDGASHVMPKAEGIRSSDQSAVYAYQTSQDDIVVHYPNGKTRTVATHPLSAPWTWDYDPVRDAVVWLQSDGIYYNSPTRSWSKSRRLFTDYSVLGCNASNGDVWTQTGGGFGGSGMAVIDPKGIDRGWRWQGKILTNLEHFMELLPEQEALARALPSRK